MKVLTLFNQYRSMFNGEEAVVHRTVDLIREQGGESHLWMPSSRGLTGPLDKAAAFLGGIYNPNARREMLGKLREIKPDVVHAHNLYPLLSPSVLGACRRAGVPVVMSLHNQNLTCPKADHLYQNRACERCFGGREYHCVLQNCRNNLLESLGYALRSGIARRLKLFRRNVTRFVALSRYARQRLILAGFNAGQIAVLPNMVDLPQAPVADPSAGGYIAFAGRLSPEKGVDTLLEAARRLHAPVRIAGDGPQAAALRQAAPSNCEFVGRVARENMAAFYRGARMVVLPSTAFEMCPLVISEAMSHGVPVVASRIGGVDELVDDGRTGLLFQPGNPGDLAAKTTQLWSQPDQCRQLGRAGFEKAHREYSETAYVGRLWAIYQESIDEAGARLAARAVPSLTA